MTPLIELLARGRHAGLTLDRKPDGTLLIRGPRTAEPIVRALLDRKTDVITTIGYYTGAAPVLGWSHATVIEPPKPCTGCGSPARLLDPYDNQPWHKSCAEAAIRWGTPRTARSAGSANQRRTA